MQYSVISTGSSRSFPEGSAFLAGASDDADILVLVGPDAGARLTDIPDTDSKAVILVELHTDTLGSHTGESRGEEGSNVLGFSRFRLGENAPSDLVELVRQPNSDESAIQTAVTLFENAGLDVAVCGDFAGRIIDQLVRPYYNEALRRLDERLASADDLDLTLKLGLGYPEGPISLLERSGLEHHYEVTRALFEVYGGRAYAPARRAVAAHQRRQRHGGTT